ncbi:MAG TPA: V-type ATPase 116kDa subunit family protein [Nitrospirota bacterium]|nr:V-type ATPase 116kDa subunit family protein [Nitrospirota bacterium]
MAKVEIVGAKGLLQDVLGCLRELGVLQIEPATIGFLEAGHEDDIRAFKLDEKTMFERVFLEGLRAKVTELLSSLPTLPVRNSYLDPRPVIDTVESIVERHTAMIKQRNERKEDLKRELTELERYSVFLGTLAPLVGSVKETPDLDFIGLTIREPEMVNHLKEALSRITDWKYELMTEPAEDGTLVGLITVERALSDRVKKTLSDEQVPELKFPPSYNNLTFLEKVIFVKKRITEVSAEIRKIDDELSQFTHRWAPIYRSVREWIDDRLAVLTTSATAFETRMCFFINGWMMANDVERLRTRLRQDFQDGVVLDEKELRESDLDRVPIILKNPPYFRPFEIFTSMLPLPTYTSYDPTPFIGIFFPIFFGMILGDAGYGLFLGGLAYFLMRKFRQKKMLRDGAKILLAASIYSIFFGILFGEFFGDLPERFFHLRPLCLERRTAVVPMIFFTLAVGVAHVFLGLLFGVIAEFRKKETKEAVYKLLNIIIVLAMIVVLASFFSVLPTVLAKPVIIAILFMTPLIFFTGGILAPLELLKNIGNIISYVRIMAIGLTSVLLAFVANNLGGLTGDVVTGIAVAGLLHLLNIILGVFSPTIHSLRLHYVEFFSKFMEQGGRRFEPLSKTT